MTQAVATQTRQDPPIAVFRNRLDKQRQDIESVLPRHVTFDRFQRVVLTALQQSQDLLDCDQRSIFQACVACAKDGLIPDGREAALVKFGNKCQYMPMVNGLIKLARQSGEVSTITAQIVYEKDTFEIDLASEARPVHKPFLDGERGKFRIAYALASFKDGTHQLEVMTLNQIEKIRSISRQKNGGPWKDHWDEMARKTVLRRLMKYLSLSPELARAIEADDATYDLSLSAPNRQALPRTLNDDYVPQAIEHQPEAAEATAHGQGAIADADTGEVTESPDGPADAYSIPDLAADIELSQSLDGLKLAYGDGTALLDISNETLFRVTKSLVLPKWREFQSPVEVVDLQSYGVALCEATSVEQLREAKANFEATKAWLDMDSPTRAQCDAFYAVARKEITKQEQEGAV